MLEVPFLFIVAFPYISVVPIILLFIPSIFISFPLIIVFPVVFPISVVPVPFLFIVTLPYKSMLPYKL